VMLAEIVWERKKLVHIEVVETSNRRNKGTLCLGDVSNSTTTDFFENDFSGRVGTRIIPFFVWFN